MYPGRSRFDHCLHQLERVEGTSKPGLGVGDYRGEPVNLSFPAQVLYLIGSLESLIDSLYKIRNAVGRVETLVRVRLPRKVSIRGYLPAAHVDGSQAGLNHLKRLGACKCT